MTRTRKPRKKATTDIGRSILQRERQRLAREQAELAEKLAEDAARSRRANTKKIKVNPLTTAEQAMQRSIVRRVAGALSSEGVNVPIEAHVIPEAQSVTAWTDFDRIYAGYHLHEDMKVPPPCCVASCTTKAGTAGSPIRSGPGACRQGRVRIHRLSGRIPCGPGWP